MGSNPCRKISLLGIAHSVVGKYGNIFQVLEVHPEMSTTEDLSWKGRVVASSFICNILG